MDTLELEALAYRDLRTHIVENWNTFNLYNSNGQIVYTKTGFTDSKIRWSHTTTRETVVIGTDINGNPITIVQNVQTNPDMQLTLRLTGSDILVPLPTNIASWEITSSRSNLKGARMKGLFDAGSTISLKTDNIVYTANMTVGV